MKTIIVAKKEAIALVTLNRPDALNAIDFTMMEELTLLLNDLRRDDMIKVVILTGAGRAFCAGADISVIAPGASAATRRNLVRGVHKIILQMANLEKPILAAVNGYAIGGGCNIALASDIIIASEKASFGQVFVTLGLVPDTGGTYMLPRTVGLAKAKELLLTGDIIDATEAHRIGMVNKVVPAEQLESTAVDLAKKLTNKPPRAMGFIKMMVNRSLGVSNLETTLQYEAKLQAICFETDDFSEGAKAFLEKKQPKFKGGMKV